jgi:hypothetical protein
MIDEHIPLSHRPVDVYMSPLAGVDSPWLLTRAGCNITFSFCYSLEAVWARDNTILYGYICKVSDGFGVRCKGWRRLLPSHHQHQPLLSKVLLALVFMMRGPRFGKSHMQCPPWIYRQDPGADWIVLLPKRSNIVPCQIALLWVMPLSMYHH